VPGSSTTNIRLQTISNRGLTVAPCETRRRSAPPNCPPSPHPKGVPWQRDCLQVIDFLAGAQNPTAKPGACATGFTPPSCLPTFVLHGTPFLLANNRKLLVLMAGYGPSAVLKNAIDWVYPEWNRKAAAFRELQKRHGRARRPSSFR
jgi:hypothetical protein